MEREKPGQWLALNRMAVLRDLNTLLERKEYALLRQRAGYFEDIPDPTIRRMAAFAQQQIEISERTQKNRAKLAVMIVPRPQSGFR